MRRMCLSLVFFSIASTSVFAATVPVHFGLFGTIHTATPAGDVKRTVVLISDRNGWDARSESLATALSDDGALVFGVDLPAYLKQMESIKDKCSLPAAHFEEMSDWMQRNQKVAKFTYPLLVGDGAGATLAYAVDAQAPKGTFAGLITLGYDFSVRLLKPICAGDAGKTTAADASGEFRIAPVGKLPNPWLPLPFAPGAVHNGALGKLDTMLKLSQHAPAAADVDLAVRLARFTEPVVSAPNLPEDVADLPLVEVAAQGTFANRYAVILTGDGGWAEEAADALTRIIGHYGAEHRQADFVVIGYSFGAALAPVVINRLPDAARARVAAQVLISPDPEAVFEVKMGDWFGSAHHEGVIPIAPEIAKTKVPVICVHGDEEGTDSFCQTLVGKPNVRQLVLSGGHHYNGDYDKLGASIFGILPTHNHFLPSMSGFGAILRFR